MRFLCDVHISFKVKRFLIGSGYACIHVNEILNGDTTSDTDIADYCNNQNLILITKDQDFTDSYLLYKKPRKLIKISLGNISNDQLISLLQTSLPMIEGLYLRDYFMAEFYKHNIQVSEE